VVAQAGGRWVELTANEGNVMKSFGGFGRRFYITALLMLIILLAIGVVTVGCSDSSTNPSSGLSGYGGDWSFDYEVIGKSETSKISISQVGNNATVIIDDGVLVELSIKGSRIFGSRLTEFALIEVDFRMHGDILRGTISSGLPGSSPHVRSGNATRIIGEVPSQKFDGYWDIESFVDNSRCEDVPAGVKIGRASCRERV